MEEAANPFGGAVPIFRVASVKASLAYYASALGFKMNWDTGQGFASVSRDKCTIFLCENDQGHAGGWAWVGVRDAGALADEFSVSGGKIRHPPTNYYWAYEMQVEDLDGNVLRFGSESRKGEAFGEFMDMDGRLWAT